MAQPILGILTLYLNNKGYLEERSVYQKMTVLGKRLGLDIVVFTPEDVNERQHRIHAMIYDPSTKKWTRKWMGLPTMIFDRCRIQKSMRFELLKRFRARYAGQLFLNRPMRNKWTVYRTLQRESRFRSHLPTTQLYDSGKELSEMLRKYPLLYLKPANGTGGRGILRIQRVDGGKLLIQGRAQNRHIIRPIRVTPASLSAHLGKWNLKSNRYLIQQGIQLKLENGRVHDYRMLVQKNGRGEWTVTGCAGRIGAPGSVTSNLHGGGRAAQMETLLRQWLGSDSRAARVKAQAEQFGVDVARHLEASYESLCELALDLAIDKNGHIWLLEVNPKPAREVFAKSGDMETYRLAIVRPLEYALWLYKNRARRSKIRTGTGRDDLSLQDTRSETPEDSESLA